MLGLTKSCRPASSNGALERFEHLLGHHGRRVAVDHVGQEDGELVTPQPGHGVPGADAVAQTDGGGAQQVVADGVAEAVVDGLEPVEVEEEQGDPLFVPWRLGQRGGDAVAEQHPVGDAAQVVVQGEVLDAGPLLDEPQEVGDGDRGDGDRSEGEPGDTARMALAHAYGQHGGTDDDGRQHDGDPRPGHGGREGFRALHVVHRVAVGGGDRPQDGGHRAQGEQPGPRGSAMGWRREEHPHAGGVSAEHARRAEEHQCCRHRASFLVLQPDQFGSEHHEDHVAGDRPDHQQVLDQRDGGRMGVDGERRRQVGDRCGHEQRLHHAVDAAASDPPTDQREQAGDGERPAGGQGKVEHRHGGRIRCGHDAGDRGRAGGRRGHGDEEPARSDMGRHQPAGAGPAVTHGDRRQDEDGDRGDEEAGPICRIGHRPAGEHPDQQGREEPRGAGSPAPQMPPRPLRRRIRHLHHPRSRPPALPPLPL